MKSIAECKTLVELFESPDRWIKGYLAKTAGGVKCSPLSKEATGFCLIGGIQKIYTRASIRYYSNGYLSVFNDHPRTTHKDLLAMAKQIDESMPSREH